MLVFVLIPVYYINLTSFLLNDFLLTLGITLYLQFENVYFQIVVGLYFGRSQFQNTIHNINKQCI